MGSIHGLAVVLIIFEGIIIQCKGTASKDATSLNWIQDAPIIEITGDQQFLPNDLIEVIISKSDFKTAQTTVGSRIINATKIVMSKILQDRIIMIVPNNFDGDTYEYHEDGDFFLKFGSYDGLMSFFDKFGDQVKKIEMYYIATGSQVLRTQISQNIINKYANNLEELRITSFDDRGVWEEMSNGFNGIIFPEVKKFQYFGRSTRNELKLNLIFPKIESIKFTGSVNDINWLENITTLKELRLSADSLKEDQLDHIFANNKNMTMIFMETPRRAETGYAIAKYLTKLETLEVGFPCGTFLFRSKNRELYRLSSVIDFHILFFDINELLGNFSFDMPHLKKLRLTGSRIDNRIIEFINYFKELETVELLVDFYDPVECIKKLKHIKQFTAKNFENSQLLSLRIFFEHFDKKSELQTLKLFNFDISSYQRYEHTMKGINTQLVNSEKPTWTLSQGEEIGTGRKYLMFKRNH